MGSDGNRSEEIDHSVSEEGMYIEKKPIPISRQVGIQRLKSVCQQQYQKPVADTLHPIESPSNSKRKFGERRLSVQN
jgi:hypothetical protein